MPPRCWNRATKDRRRRRPLPFRASAARPCAAAVPRRAPGGAFFVRRPLPRGDRIALPLDGICVLPLLPKKWAAWRVVWRKKRSTKLRLGGSQLMRLFFSSHAQ